jgi:hypothetical protein
MNLGRSSEIRYVHGSEIIIYKGVRNSLGRKFLKKLGNLVGRYTTFLNQGFEIISSRRLEVLPDDF